MDSIVDKIERRIAEHLAPDADGNVTIEYGDFPTYGSTRKHAGVTRREVVNLRELDRALLTHGGKY